jgi:putative FmdB family regulatory protein
MPNYEYLCKDCQERQTIARSISARERLPKCPKCQATMIRVYQLPAIAFNGTGWASKEN